MGKEQVNVRERSKPEALELATDAELPGQIVEGTSECQRVVKPVEARLRVPSEQAVATQEQIG